MRALTYLEHGVPHAFGGEDAVPEEVVHELFIGLAAGSPRHAGVQEVGGCCYEALEFGECGLPVHMGKMV